MTMIIDKPTPSFTVRDGVSEGQFKQVLEQEIPEIEKVKTNWENGTSSIPPSYNIHTPTIPSGMESSLQWEAKDHLHSGPEEAPHKALRQQ